jgi:hypothetical protein
LKLLTAVLSSEDLEKTKRCLTTVGDDVVLIVNTLNKDYIKEVLDAKLNVSQFAITLSNGTPGLGKQSVLDYFLKTNYTHLTFIDSDDYYMPGGIERIKKHLEGFDYVGCLTDVFTPQRKLISMVEWKYPKTLRKEFATDSDKFKTFFATMRKIGQTYSTETIVQRIVGLSKHGARAFKFSDKLMGLDDVQAQVNLALECSKGNIKGKIVYDKDIYLYDRSDGAGTLSDFVDKTFTPEQEKIFWEGIHEGEYDAEAFEYESVISNLTEEERMRIILDYDIQRN